MIKTRGFGWGRPNNFFGVYIPQQLMFYYTLLTNFRKLSKYGVLGQGTVFKKD